MSDEAHLPELHEQTGVVLLWASRPEIGRYGYLIPFRGCALGNVFFFDESALGNPAEPLFDGAVVRYQTDRNHTRPKLRGIRLETFQDHNPELDFTDVDLMFGSFVLEWLDVVENPRNPTAKHLNKLLALIPDEQRSHDDFLLRLVMRLNEIIGGPLIYDKYDFAKVKLRNCTRNLLKKKPGGFELRLLNRLLLEDALKTVHPGGEQFPDCAPEVVEAEVYDNDDEYQSGLLKTPFKPARFHYHSLPSDTLIPPDGSTVLCRVLSGSRAPELTAYDVWESHSAGVPIGVSADQRSAVMRGGFSRNEDKSEIKKRYPQLLLPIQYNWVEGALIGANGLPSSPLPQSIDVVLKAWLAKNPSNPKSKFILGYGVIATLHTAGRIKSRQPKISERELKAHPDFKKAAANPTKTAHQFARTFTRWLEQRGISANAIFVCDRKSKTYVLVGSGWHSSKLVLDHSEVSLQYRDDPERKLRKQLGSSNGGEIDDNDDAEDDSQNMWDQNFK